MPRFPFFFLSGFLLEVTINYTSSALAHMRMISILQKRKKVLKKRKIISKKVCYCYRQFKMRLFCAQLGR